MHCPACRAVNISATGLLGKAVFGEATSLQWWVGATSILVGSVLINRSQRKAAEPQAAAVAGGVALKVPGAERRVRKGCCCCCIGRSCC
jgi:drug/metabolite transporter (DMT)-like permease